MIPNAAFLERWLPLRPVMGGGDLVAHQGDAFAIWSAWEEESGQSLSEAPFWAAVWPAAVLMAEFLREHPALVRNLEVMDVGCGGGVAGVAAAVAGASQVWANDLDDAAVAVAQANAAANGVVVRSCVGDANERPDLERVQVILVADLFYDRDGSHRLAEALDQQVSRGALVLVGDWGRSFLPEARGQVVAERSVPVDTGLEGVNHRWTRLLRW